MNSISATSLLLASPLLAGVPATNMFVQRVIGFVDREGGSYFQEFSAVFVAEAGPGGRLYYYYPRVRTVSSATESRAPIGGGFDAWWLPARLIALPTTDINDSEQVLCYRSYIPAKTAAI